MNRITKTAIKISISALVLLVLIVGGGVGYIWYVGQNSPDVVVEEAPKPVKSSIVTAPAKPADDAKVGASVQALTSPVTPGMNSSIIVKTTPGAKCVISVTYDKVASTDSGLAPKEADEYGVVNWAWTVGTSIAVGKYPVKVTCVRGKNSGVTGGTLEVVKVLEE